MNTIAKSDVKSPLREVRVRVAMVFALLMLSCDALNPVKIITDVFGINPWIIFVLSFLYLISMLVSNASELTYFSLKVFFHSILSIFFSSMEVLGTENIPPHGPVIFTGNHMNQFVDGAIMMVSSPLPLGFLVAAKSMDKPIIGHFSKAIGSIPVSRPQDSSKPGPGKITIKGKKIYGEGTHFLSLKKGERIRPSQSVESFRVTEIISDTEATLLEDFGEDLLNHACQGRTLSYDIFEYVDQSKMFDSVYSAIANGKNLGIFPEGGSHDRTDLLPLKAGVSSIALGVLEQHGVNVPIIPVGLNYFKGHRFRGRAVIEFGEPIYITDEIIEEYKKNKKNGIQTLLNNIGDGMRSVLVTARDYNELKLIHTVRRLIQNNSNITTKSKQDLARRLSYSYRIISDENFQKSVTKPELFPNANPELKNLPSELETLKADLVQYQSDLEALGIKDYQLLKSNIGYSYPKLLFNFLHGIIILFLASIPSLLLNAPVGWAAHMWSAKEAKKDLSASRVKLAARDVLLSKKILFSLVAVPALWLFYAFILLFFTDIQLRTVLILLLCCPIFSYMGVMAVEASMMNFKDIKPAFMKLLPGYAEDVKKLYEKRENLKHRVKSLIKKYGPMLGAVYLDTTDNWELKTRKILHNIKSKETGSSNPNPVTVPPTLSSDSNGIPQNINLVSLVNDLNDGGLEDRIRGNSEDLTKKEI